MATLAQNQKPVKLMTLEGTRFGPLDYFEEDVVTFGEGLIGFPHTRDFIVLSIKPDSPFRWLQSLDEPALAFLIADPNVFVPTYNPEISAADATSLGIQEDTPRIVFTTVSIPTGKPEAMTINLAGPLLINAQTRQAAQIVIEDEAYTIRHRVFQEANQASESVAA